MDDDLHGRRPPWKTTFLKDDLNSWKSIKHVFRSTQVEPKTSFALFLMPSLRTKHLFVFPMSKKSGGVKIVHLTRALPELCTAQPQLVTLLHVSKLRICYHFGMTWQHFLEESQVSQLGLILDGTYY
jgi:hypothetical protein